MSGIAAIFNSNGDTPNEKLIVDMAALMAVRGPKYQQYWCEKTIAMAHTLLPTSRHSLTESQPSTLDGRVWISADVRIDGREELIAKIQAHQTNVDSNTTDDKLILYAYQTWGSNCLQHLIGDFAFILWDATKQRLLCATDQFGVAPLYYATTPQGLCISNTLNAIRLHPNISNKLDDLAVADYLLFRINQNPNGTFFEHIKHLPAGHFLIHEKGKMHIKRYWSLDEDQELQHTGPNQYLEEFEALLKRAIADRSYTDSVGVHLSGGMDSSSVAALCNTIMDERKMPNRVVAYTYGASGSLPDLEEPFAQEIAKRYGMEHHTFKGSNDILNAITAPDSLRSPEPRFTTRQNSNYQLLQHAASHSGVLLTGFGGDPLLYPNKLDWLSINTPSKMVSMLKQFQHHWSLYQKCPPLGLKRNKELKLAYQSIKGRKLPDWLNPQFANQHQLQERMQATLAEKIDPFRARTSMASNGLWRRIFCWNDPGFTHIPVRVRHPFFDTRLLKYAQSLPPIPWLHDKTILRQSMKHLLPESVIVRPKTPLPGNGLQSTLSNTLEAPERYLSLLDNNLLEKYINPKQLKSKLNITNLSTKTDFKAIMRAVTLSDWLIGYELTPVTHKFKGNKAHVTRIKYKK